MAILAILLSSCSKDVYVYKFSYSQPNTAHLGTATNYTVTKNALTKEEEHCLYSELVDKTLAVYPDAFDFKLELVDEEGFTAAIHYECP